MLFFQMKMFSDLRNILLHFLKRYEPNKFDTGIFRLPKSFIAF